jgi:hypothetical protein
MSPPAGYSSISVAPYSVIGDAVAIEVGGLRVPG